jgi:hypothetical protein
LCCGISAAVNTYRESVLAAIDTNTAANIKLCGRGAAAESMNCGSSAAKNRAVFWIQ